MPIAQQPFQEMAKNVQNSHFSFARIFILVENMPLRSSPLLEAAERYRQAILSEIEIIKLEEIKFFPKLNR
ncbi:MAG: hypothetical protein RI980_977 [Bacteroidota bacterium]